MTTSSTFTSSIRRKTATGRRSAFVLAFSLSLAAGCSNGGGQNGKDAGVTDGPKCAWDSSTDAASAVALTEGTPVTGWLCPVDDVDWYSFTTGPSDHLVEVKLAMNGPLSPVQPTYTIRKKNADGSAGKVVASPPAAEVGGALDMVHCMAPGSYYITVNDLNNDGEDIRHMYTLSVSSQPDPDPSEPNDDPTSAVALTSGTAVGGSIACRGDQDFYSIDVPANGLLDVHLVSPIANYQPTFAVEASDGSTLVSLSNPAGAVKATDLDRLVAVPSAGTWYVVISDDDGMSSDPSVPYALTVTVVQDKDPNEPNNTPATATSLNQMSCGASWSSPQTIQGTFSTIGDQDWFRIPISNCVAGLIEATVTMDTSGMSAQDAWNLQSSVQASAALVRPHMASACSKDTDCRELDQPCSSGWDCAGYFNQCQPDGLCAGASTCLAEGVCGATEVQRSYTEATVPSPVTSSPPPDKAVLSAPLFGGSYVYLRVSDYQANGFAPNTFYTLSVRVRHDPDVHEPDNAYTPAIQQKDPAGPQEAHAIPIPVHDCVAGDCCNANTWVTGSIGYEMDQDWYSYQHPCPGADCMVRIVYELDPGPVDFYISTYAGQSGWFNDLSGTTEKGTQSAITGSYGGTTSTDQCYYAWQGHTGAPFNYYVAFRDYAKVHDWDPDQQYRFCVEKVADGCSDPPCQLYSNGCGCKVSDPNCGH